jgi:molecular chaperone GrpE (heat shock protein)
MDEKDLNKVNEAIERLNESVRDFYEVAAENTAAVQESNIQLAQNLFGSGVEALRIQAEFNQYTLQNLSEQFQKHQEVFRELSRDSLGAYENFLDSLFSYYEEVLGESEKVGD